MYVKKISLTPISHHGQTHFAANQKEPDSKQKKIKQTRGQVPFGEFIVHLKIRNSIYSTGVQPV